MGYGSFIRFDHDFIGREALERLQGRPHRRKVTFEWNGRDVAAIVSSMFEEGDVYKYIDWPNTNYSSSSYDRIVSGGKTVGLSMFGGYSYNERAMLSLGVIDEACATPGTPVTLVWGEGRTWKGTFDR
jgi:vanillate/3-O-methylgallate O-demethylase